ncbi:MAG TPA: 50S ribosomal protein L18 [Candidatus Magasanikbacteria bacterium]|uniref:Large ribosomal subunit protein uL18 n=2 Tax=Candidatus Magasanikiibacteriota TaxID=1752731 RepID=A0A0G0YT93_9BACT|nr:MAG: 50S ribosomal protein L18 [Candidatus Magasanikbacteria bacterium GW2011_GWC2_41_17]KKS12871.1 MAG: 50S ribosomal protein L18 [Candidatus Magasanikbacteria bacterium GW2011_GWA2_41_55]HBV57925.1 50S ribosomal protein L18 [Candidatus Magasanikbacteria bacterium]HBX16290.1 50S ribosomal protein L18 [Candidatus Magasanikbacteria bacterium]
MKSFEKIKVQARKTRHRRVRAKVIGTEKKPRLCVYRSSKNVFAQLINDDIGKTIIGINTQGLKPTEGNLLKGKESLAFEAGKLIAKTALEKGIKEICFDRGGYLYHGRVKAVAEGARAGGLKF